MKSWRRGFAKWNNEGEATFHLIMKECFIFVEGFVCLMILKEEHNSPYAMHPDSNKIYHDLCKSYQWPSLKITKDFLIRLPVTVTKKDAVWVIVDCLAKRAHFLAVPTSYSLHRLTKIYISKIVRLHGMEQGVLGSKLEFSTAYHPQTYGQAERVIQVLEYMLRSYILEFARS
ncbi:DNA/RNA polymerases superfamily protein [Gossypium australe]|uniref:DNA/RNA polymerases superfamily protein n=1 Tax=Gossypium australe TaxID=47621 RepID=A0A5B6VAC9_9ROSI|nr:DNA/RNA polymerases superfamily protein [Gossypium australe]